MSSIKGTVKFYIKQGKKGEWEQCLIYVRAEDREKLRKFKDKEITLYLNSGSTGSTVERELLNLLVKLFTKAFSNQKIAKELLKETETEQILKLLEGEG